MKDTCEFFQKVKLGGDSSSSRFQVCHRVKYTRRRLKKNKIGHKNGHKSMRFRRQEVDTERGAGNQYGQLRF